MSFSLITVLGIMFFFLLIGSPVIFALGSAALTWFIIRPDMWSSIPIYAHKLFTGMNIFVFLCIPLFVMAGEIMGNTGIGVFNNRRPVR